MGIAKNILQQLTVLAGELAGSSRDDYFSAVLPSLALLSRTFPPLSSEVTAFLVHLSKICHPTEQISSSVAKTKGILDAGDLWEESVPLARVIENTFMEVVALVAK